MGEKKEIKKEKEKTAEDYLRELTSIVKNVEGNGSTKKILSKFIGSKKKALSKIDHYLSFGDRGTLLFSIIVEGDDKGDNRFISRAIKTLIVDGVKETTKYIQETAYR